MYDVAPDERSFVMVRHTGDAPAPVVVIGWADEVRRTATGNDAVR